MNGGLIKFRQSEYDKGYHKGGYDDLTEAFFECESNKYDSIGAWQPWGPMEEEGKAYNTSFERACYKLIAKNAKFSKTNMMARHGLTRQRLDNWLQAFCEDNGFVTERVFRGYKFREC